MADAFRKYRPRPPGRPARTVQLRPPRIARSPRRIRPA